MTLRQPGPVRATVREILLAAALLLLLFVVWFEPVGSGLAEPDETRYAQIPREMIARGDFVTPRLNGVPYFEKPPLLYWANAASFLVFGETSFAARLPARLAALGTVVLLFLAGRSLWGREAGLAAGLFYLLAPLGFALARSNVTDGLLTFFFAGTLLGGREAMCRGTQGLRTTLLAALTGLAAAGAVLAKGAVGVVLPGAILAAWGLITGPRRLRPLLLGPGVPVFLGVAAPWFVLMELGHPGFLKFFFVREHLLRFTTTLHGREGPPFYFLAVFCAGFLTGLPFIISAVSRLGRAPWRTEPSLELFFLIWLAVVVTFFSFSGSKLPPYILPAFPAAALLSARASTEPAPGRFAAWLFQAGVAALLIGVGALHPDVRSWIADYELQRFAVAAGIALAAGASAAVILAALRKGGSLAAFALGWAGVYGCLVLAWPKSPPSSELRGLGQIARLVTERTPARVVFYNTLLYGVLWELEGPLAITGYKGELRRQAVPSAAADPSIFWTDERFWAEWSSTRPLLAVVRGRNLPDLSSRGAVQILGRGRDHFLVSNFAFGQPPFAPLPTSVALYTPEADAVSIALDQVPARAMDRARRESRGDRLVWALREQEHGTTAYEVITSGRRPRALEVSAGGDLVYVEEEVDPRRLPKSVLGELSRIYPGLEVVYATRESRRRDGPPVVYEVYLRRGAQLREVSFAESGRLFLAEQPVY